MGMHSTGGDFLAPGTVGLNDPGPDPGPVGVVSTDPELIADYLETCPSPYVIIRSVRDVPARLGGVALLDGVHLDDALTAALSAALLA